MDARKAKNDSEEVYLSNWITILCLAGSILLLWVSAFQSCVTYYATPSIENFSKFVNPTLEKNLSKGGYLFSPLLLFFVGICTILFSENFLNARHPKLRVLNRRPIRAVLLLLWSLIFFAMLSVDHGRAMHAASRYPQKWLANHDSWIDPVCSAVRLGGIFDK